MVANKMQATDGEAVVTDVSSFLRKIWNPFTFSCFGL